MCRWVLGFPRNLGDPVVSMEEFPGGGYRVTNPRPVAVTLGGDGSERASVPTVPSSEGNEVRREGRQEVVVP